MSPVPIVVGLVVALLAVIFAWSGMSLACGLVMLLAAIIIGLLFAFYTLLPKWPG